jgi:hypothetical protein
VRKSYKIICKTAKEKNKVFNRGSGKSPFKTGVSQDWEGLFRVSFWWFLEVGFWVFQGCFCSFWSCFCPFGCLSAVFAYFSVFYGLLSLGFLAFFMCFLFLLPRFAGSVFFCPLFCSREAGKLFFVFDF